MSRPDGRPRRQNLYEAEGVLYEGPSPHSWECKGIPPNATLPSQFKAVFPGVMKPIIVPANPAPIFLTKVAFGKILMTHQEIIHSG